jgi:hypothetical protein
VYQVIQAFLSCCLFLACGAIGLALGSRLSERHRDRETMEFLRLAVGALVTFLAIVLGLLTASSKSHFDDVANSYRHLSAQIVQFDHLLREVQTNEANEIRAAMRSYLASVVASTWPLEAPPNGSYLHDLPGGQSESVALSTLLASMELRLRTMHSADFQQAQLIRNSLDKFTAMTNARWTVIETGHSSMPAPFFDVMVIWTGLMFLGFGLSAPRNAVSTATMVICALSLASIIYVILELDDPLGGLIAISSAPLREALADLDLP